MYYRLNENEMDIIEKASDITDTDYDLCGEFIPADNFVNIIENLLCKLDRTNEELEDLKEDMESNYKPIPAAEQYGISDRDFM